jgi:hypothetical protein
VSDIVVEVVTAATVDVEVVDEVVVEVTPSAATVEVEVIGGGPGGGPPGVTDHGALTGLADDDHPQYARKAQNLGDLTDAAAARSNLGLGSAATQPTSAFDAAGAATAAASGAASALSGHVAAINPHPQYLPAGQGVPTGGASGQVLTKDSSTDHDTSWATGPIIRADWSVRAFPTGGFAPVVEMFPGDNLTAWETADVSMLGLSSGGGPALWAVPTDEGPQLICYADLIDTTRCGVYVYTPGVSFVRAPFATTTEDLDGAMVASKLRLNHTDNSPVTQTPFGYIPNLLHFTADDSTQPMGTVEWNFVIFTDLVTTQIFFDFIVAMTGLGWTPVSAYWPGGDPDNFGEGLDALAVRTTAIEARPTTVSLAVTDPAGPDVATGDGQAYFTVPAELNGRNITAVHAALTTAGATTATTVQVARTRTGSTVDVLTTKATIDATELTSYTGTAGAPNTSNDDLATGDLLRVDVDTVGTGAKGLQVILSVGP